MKTNVIMVRDMGGLTVLQSTDTGMFNANELAKQYSERLGNPRAKSVNDFMKLDKTKEFIEALHIEINDNTKKVVLSKKGKNGGTWMHPYLFIDFAMWLNPSFKVQVLRFVYDELIKNRHEAGDMYRTLSSSITKLPGYSFKEVATALQWVVFGMTGKNLRQTATQAQLKELADAQTKLAFAIDMGYIKSFSHLKDEMRKMWHNNKHKFQIQKQTA